MKYTYLDCLASFGIGGAHPGGLQLTKEILSKEEITETSTILDAGCGTGQTSAYIAETYKCSITGLDHNEMMVEKAKQRFQSKNLSVEARHGSVENLPFGEKSFDMILSESVLSFTDVTKTIPELRRVLKPDGVLLAIEMVLETPLPKEERATLTKFYGIPRILTEAQWNTLFQKADFQHIHMEKFTLSFDEPEFENASDFSLSEQLDEELYSILDQHLELTERYKKNLGFRVFRCCV
ncbi:class I SAM-dependent methyltransferase [Bacillus sp. FJAT-27251]|uniref:class I SAM-dependent methyltransferase n=1 Tax=Bacillus sp. FJAT-27251 TaxID=1684142 RepID=UPI0006A7D376|nr:class I SAM-dependent methyltransferase [Bacillus sp. FJAT-27251]